MDLKPAIGVKVTTQNGRLALPIVRRPRIVILPDLNALPTYLVLVEISYVSWYYMVLVN